MDADATAALRKKAIASTDDKFKFIWFKVCESIFVSKYAYIPISGIVVQFRWLMAHNGFLAISYSMSSVQLKKSFGGLHYFLF